MSETEWTPGMLRDELVRLVRENQERHSGIANEPQVQMFLAEHVSLLTWAVGRMLAIMERQEGKR